MICSRAARTTPTAGGPPGAGCAVADAASTKDAAIKADNRIIAFRCERDREVREQVETIRDSRGDQTGSSRVAMRHTPTRACSLAVVLLQQLQHVVGGVRLAQPRKDL